MFEVHFRGKNAFEAGQAVPVGSGDLGAWKPTEASLYECTETEARKRYEELVSAGVAGVGIDGVIPHVVVIHEKKYAHRKGQDGWAVDVMLWQYAEPEAMPEGPWAN